jgi:protein TonB
MGLTKWFLSYVFMFAAVSAIAQPDPEPNPVLPEPPAVWVEETPLAVSETPAEYPGGTEALMKDLAKLLVYPQFCIDQGVEGKVFVKFIVEKNGKISNPEILKKPDGDCGVAMGKESIRVVRMLRDFTPAMQNGVPVRVYMTLPIYFKLN